MGTDHCEINTLYQSPSEIWVLCTIHSSQLKHWLVVGISLLHSSAVCKAQGAPLQVVNMHSPQCPADVTTYGKETYKLSLSRNNK